MPRGQYKRTKEIMEKYSKKKIGKLNPSYIKGAYCEQNKIDEMMEKVRKAKEQKVKRTYLNKDWMINKYCIEECSIQKIAELCKVSYDDIWFGLKKLGIPRISIIGRIKWHEWVEKAKIEIV